MDARALRELELWPVARLYGLQQAVTSQPAAAIAAWRAPGSPWLFVGAIDEEAEGRLLGAMMAAVGCKERAQVGFDEAVGAAKVIVALGDAAAQQLLGTSGDLSGLRGAVHRHAGIPVVATHHPAALLQAPERKAQAWEDLVLARRTLAGT
jgi:hypothetical protein